MSYKLSIGLALLAIQIGWFNFSWLLALSLTFVIYLVFGGWKFVRLLYLTFPRDISYLLKFMKAGPQCKKIIKNNLTVCDIFEESAKKYKEKVLFVFEDKKWTFEEVDRFSNQIANHFQNIGYKKGDVVALLMENRPELVFFWLGLAKIGVISSLINYNIRKDSLAHCISIVNAKGLVYSSENTISDAVVDISSKLNDIELFEFGEGSSNGLKSQNILEKLDSCSKNPPALNHEKKYDDVLFYIYTSGTTGLPKASVIKHDRFLRIAYFFTPLMKFDANDVMYCVLPLYHTSAGVLGVGAALLSGYTMVVRRKFSASRFWEECIHYKATCALYIGELCRYLIAQPPNESEKKHSLRLMFGNGLRPEIWKELQTRSNVPSIVEFYGATEGNIATINVEGRLGSIGYFPVTFRNILPMRLLKTDSISGKLLRGPDGFCIPCQPGESGQIAGLIKNKGQQSNRFDGYVNKEATEKKIARDVVKKGDQWFLSGDMMYWDELGYLFFQDRMGDTFRWRGENVSTTEVENAISSVLDSKSVVVFGVEIPGCEGCAGMAAIEDPEEAIDEKILGKKLSSVLPPYARPIFLRITNTVDTTGTFKFQKARFRKEGFNLSIIKDKLFYFDPKSDEYQALTKEIHKKFLDGEMRV